MNIPIDQSLPLLERLRAGEVPDPEVAWTFEENAIEALDADRRHITRLAVLAHQHVGEPEEGDREKAWNEYRYIEGGAARHWAAELYLLTDPEQQQAKGRVIEYDKAQAEADDPLSGWTYEVAIPAEYAQATMEKKLVVRMGSDGEWWVTCRFDDGSFRGITKHDYVLRAAIDGVVNYFGGPRPWVEAAELEVVTAALNIDRLDAATGQGRR